jgi:hypothetical protein
MEIKFSRHAKRRAKLYGISESTVIDVLRKGNRNWRQGEHEIIKDVHGFKYTLKIIVSVSEHLITVITNYPLKKGRKK